MSIFKMLCHPVSDLCVHFCLPESSLAFKNGFLKVAFTVFQDLFLFLFTCFSELSH